MRSVWKGSLSFGLVNIPVHLYTASVDKEISFILLHKKDNSEIRYARICKAEEKEVPWKEIVKGYEYKKGSFVVLDDTDFEKVNIKKTKTIEVINFVNEDDIDSMYYVKPYYLEPDKNAAKAYGILRDALLKTKKVGLAKYVIRNREHLAIVKVHENMLILNELRYEHELLKPEDISIPKTKASAKELNLAAKLIEQLTIPFQPKKYRDTYTEEIKQLIRKKAKGKPVHPKTEEAPKKTKIVDMVSLLQASVESPKRHRSAK